MAPSGAPPPHVLAAWAVGDPQPLPGGEGRSWRAGPLVLKPVDDTRRTEWLAGVLDGVPRTDPDLRIVRPVRAGSGRWVVDGWAAWHWLEGTQGRRIWEEVLEVSARFHRATADVMWAPELVASHRWAVADRVAWGEAEPAESALPAFVRSLLGRRRPVDQACQLVHGDLTGNVLVHETLPPAVIDVSPYWRPAGYADAVVVADALAWHGAPDALLERHVRVHGDQLLLRAVLFRVGADPATAAAYGRVVTLLDS